MESTTPYYDYSTIDYEMYYLFERMYIFLVVSYSLVFVLGSIGNGLVIFITSFRMKKTVNTIWILNLAIADFTFSISLLFNLIYVSLWYHWPFGSAMCKLSHTMVFFNLFASIYLLVVISVDRCISVWCPVWARNHRTPRLASFVVLGVWILALMLCSPDLYFKGNYYNDNTNAVHCYNDYGIIGDGGIRPFYAVVTIRVVFGFIIPFIIIVVCYGAIVVRLRRDRLSHSSKPFKVITAVIVAFLACWFPFHFFSIFELKALSEFKVDIMIYTGLKFSSSLAYFNSCLNPILYFCMGHNFKKKLSCSLLSAFVNAFTEDSNHGTTKMEARTSGELEAGGL